MVEVGRRRPRIKLVHISSLLPQSKMKKKNKQLPEAYLPSVLKLQ